MKKTIIAVAMTLTIMGCGDDHNSKQSSLEINEPIFCTQELVPSIILTIKNASTGNLVQSASATFTVDGANPKSVTCDENATQSVKCEALFLGEDIAGQFEIDISSPGFTDQHASVLIEKTPEGCHVLTQELEVSLQPL